MSNIFIKTGDGRKNGEFLAMTVRTGNPNKNKKTNKLRNTNTHLIT